MSDQLRVIFFDVDDTLYSTSEFASRARWNAVQAIHRQGVRLPVNHLYAELQEIVSEFTSNYDHHFDKLLVRLPRRAYEGTNRAVLVAAAVAAYHDTKTTDLKPFQDVLGLLKRLATTDLVRGVITSGLEVKQAEKLLRLGVYPYLTPTAIFISDQIGINKPNPKLFVRACDELGVDPKETMYIGDDPVNDVDASHRAGMVSVLVRRGGKHSGKKGEFDPTHSVADFDELATLLVKDYGIPLGESSGS